MQTGKITLDIVRRNPKIKTYMEAANNQMNALGYTEHGFRHAGIVAETAHSIMAGLGQGPREAELAAIAGYLHDIGNAVSRQGHTDSAAIMAFMLLNEMGMPASEIALIIAAIGNHEEEIGSPVSAISAALILADKSDVHHSRVQNQNPLTFDIHDRVNYSVQRSNLRVDTENKSINLELTTDEKSASVMEYFEIFLSRMLICRRAADYFGYKFKLVINGVDM
ncbi:MAG: HD domain-containing protein [Armatimonadota bacterium]|jgi:metal-dependent HD superfamily phosphatase/phosphodiesterase